MIRCLTALILLACGAGGFAAAGNGARAGDGAAIRLTGVVTDIFDDDLDTNWSWLTVRDAAAAHTVAVNRRILSWTNALALVDAEVAFTGVDGAPQAYRPTISAYLQCSGVPPVILKPAPARFDEIPFKKWHENSPHRRRVAGYVAAVTKTAFYLADSTKVVPQPGERMPAAGDPVVVAGFISATDPGRIMTRALVRPNPKPTDRITNTRPLTDIEKLFHHDDGYEVPNIRHNGIFVQLAATVTASEANPRTGFTFEMTDRKRTLFVDASAYPETAAVVEDGCRVEVTGIAIFEFERVDAGIFPVFRRVRIVPRAADDIRVLARPPWWTPARLALVIALLLVVLIALGVFTRFLWSLATRRAKEALHDRLARAHAESRTAERTRLATDLHDTLAQNLTGVTLQIDAAKRAQTRRPTSVGEHLDTAGRMLASCRTELRRCLWDLRYEALDARDFAAALRMTLDTVRGDATVTIDAAISRSALTESLAHAILQATRELVSNAVVHGRARNVRVAGEIAGGVLRLAVTDDGCGFDPDAAPGMAEGHFGLVGVRDRLRALGGALHLDSEPGRGTTATLTLPLPEI